ncbi:hypothetical protein BJ875DRAFT_97011 [Amylocarpus encephaloides]|uniref:Zn(2)-C6 fungal-type domain-containing protein n=1 Tax=Amylocarpus encephaloides TaxID=45428 RepID=A0A9P7YEL8_9HELO|nr:hypothetical protein BJ875DRAFT_97011 [Amylocarpus encephaloides]
MSNAQQQQQQPGAQSRQPVNYPSPASYPSPSLSNNNHNTTTTATTANTSSYNYPPPANPQSEPYRASPTGSNASLSLPSMRTLDPVQQQQQGQHLNHNMSGLPPVAPMHSSSYYPNPVQHLPHPGYGVTSDPNGNGNMRFALPHHQDARVMSGGRHKKEIKRRTKTGCLTCRKRRIKCDEAHPHCRNCQKSKRDCMGYDPIFKQQPQGPTSIQPAPSSASTQAGSPATANPYGNQQNMYSMPTAPIGYDASSAGVSSPGSANQPYDYTNAIDPALEAAPPAAANSAYATSAKRPIHVLLALGGSPPNPTQHELAQLQNVLDETKHLYYSIYAPGIENFLESKWFASKGMSRLIGSRELLDQFALLLFQFTKTATGDPKEMAYTSSVEARIVWYLANMVRSTAADPTLQREQKTVPSTDDPVEAGMRLTVFENLLTGGVSRENRLTAPVAGSTDHHRLRELEFWFTLGNFVCLRGDDPASEKDVDNTLAALRNLLDGRENRDVLYSIAVVRALGPRVSEYPDSELPLHLDESDNKSKLVVAKKFIMDEAQGSGTTNVIRRLCELAARSWAAPPAAAPTAPAPAPSGTK